MPIFKVKREDILRKPEIDEMLRKAKTVYLGERLQCVIALAWCFGKRIMEILKLRRKDVWTDHTFLYVRFHVSKKKTRKDTPVPRPFLKRIRLEHPYVPYVLNWVSTISEGYVFPSYGKRGHITDTRMRQLLKQVNPDAYWHLFRESLATYMAENGATEEELLNWFDWDRVDTAHQYVKRGTKLTEKWSERTF